MSCSSTASIFQKSMFLIGVVPMLTQSGDNSHFASKDTMSLFYYIFNNHARVLSLIQGKKNHISNH